MVLSITERVEFLEKCIEILGSLSKNAASLRERPCFLRKMKTFTPNCTPITYAVNNMNFPWGVRLYFGKYPPQTDGNELLSRVPFIDAHHNLTKSLDIALQYSLACGSTMLWKGLFGAYFSLWVTFISFILDLCHLNVLSVSP